MISAIFSLGTPMVAAPSSIVSCPTRVSVISMERTHTTRTPNGLRSTARDLVKDSMTPDPALMKCLAAARAVMNWDRTIVVMGSMNASAGSSIVLVAFRYSTACGPMALNRMSMRPAAATTSSRWLMTASSSRASTSAAAAVPPRFQIA
jgi:hypothetical protein